VLHTAPNVLTITLTIEQGSDRSLIRRKLNQLANVRNENHDLSAFIYATHTISEMKHRRRYEDNANYAGIKRYAVSDWQEVAAVRQFTDACRRAGSATVNRFIYPGSPIQIIPVAVFL
jgi:hypothetical protein